MLTDTAPPHTHLDGDVNEGDLRLVSVAATKF
jgi:hypothetical protein